MCEPCKKKQKGVKKGIVIKFHLSLTLVARLTSLISNHSHTEISSLLWFIRSKFVVLRALKTKTAEEVVYNLIDMFMLFGGPSILQPDNGREFSNKTVNNLKEYSPSLKIVHGDPRNSQSSVERANQEIENMTATWMQDEKTDQWSEGLWSVQLMKNRALHSDIKRSPYEALFGCKVKVGLTTSSVPHDVLETLESKDLEQVINNIKTTQNPGTSITESTNPTMPNLIQVTEHDRTLHFNCKH